MPENFETSTQTEAIAHEYPHQLWVVALRPTTEIGPDSLLWHYAGDWRIGFTGLSAGVLQLMHPAIGAGVAEHSKFFDEPWDRIYRSIPEIIGTVYDPDPEATGHKVRDYHKDIKGKDEQGRRYHALNPETYWWAHATFHTMVEDVADRFSHRNLSQAEREQLYAETTEWYRRYGLSMRPVPANYQAFRDKWQNMCDEVLEMTPAAEKAIAMAVDRNVERVPYIPPLIWKLGRLPVSESIRIVTIGGLPKTVRERFDIPWSMIDEVRLKALEVSVQNGWRFIHPKLRYHPRARAGNRQASRAA